MKLTKIHTAGSDYLVCAERMNESVETAKRLLDRRRGIGADGFVSVEPDEGCDAKIRLLLANGEESTCSATAVISAAKFLYDNSVKKKKYGISFGGRVYHVKMSVMAGRVVCAWLEMPKLVPKPLEQLKYYHGIRGEVLRACIVHPRVSVYELCGAHAVFMLESAAALRALNMQSVCRRLEEVLFFGESIDLHFAAIAGDNALVMRSWRCKIGEMGALGEGAVLAAYAAVEYETVDSSRVLVKNACGSFCVELAGNSALLCAKCETVFCGEAI
ncbi:MAG: hypothetical protein E7598_01755 [Ruminococcaceae bacterium]|nr:hypothetical protein [Oscillospiraceae bacterium]